MTELKKQVTEFLLTKGLTEQLTSSGICYFHRYSKGVWYGTDWAGVKFPNYYDTSNRIEVSTGYSGAFSGDEGYDIAEYKGSPVNFEEFLTVLELTKFNDQVEKGKNQYIFSQSVADYKN
jgi:hypothetical protein